MLIRYCDTCGTRIQEMEHKNRCKDCRAGKIKKRFEPSDSGRLPLSSVTALLKDIREHRPAPNNMLEN